MALDLRRRPPMVRLRRWLAGAPEAARELQLARALSDDDPHHPVRCLEQGELDGVGWSAWPERAGIDLALLPELLADVDAAVRAAIWQGIAQAVAFALPRCPDAGLASFAVDANGAVFCRAPAHPRGFVPDDVPAVRALLKTRLEHTQRDEDLRRSQAAWRSLDDVWRPALAADHARLAPLLEVATRLGARRKPSSLSTSRITASLRIHEGPAAPPTPLAPHNVPSGMVLVPGGKVLVQDVDDDDVLAAHPGVTPPALVTIAPFFMDIVPVTLGDYLAFCDVAGVAHPACWPARWRRPDARDTLTDDEASLPAVGVSHADAEAYARHRGARLPTEVEWLLAGRGHDDRRWPWGDTFEASLLPALSDDGPAPLHAGERHNRSPFGVALMCRQWEWTASPALELHDDAWIIRGGRWRDHAEPPALDHRSYEVAGALDVGFRCARSLPDAVRR